MSVVPSTVETLNEQAAAVLAVSIAALDQTDARAPERSYVAPAAPAFDCCPFLTVHVPALTQDSTGAGPGGVALGHRSMRGSIILATYVVLAIRCAVTPNGNTLPSPAALEASARQVQQDGWALWNHLRAAIKCGDIFGLCEEVYFDGGASVPEQGGCVGWEFTIRASIPGIPSTCPDEEV